ncbi:hydroxyphenylacetyl-CoA thioesterase PaaI [Nitratireductor sp. CH_MIT9313-5]|jgi:acyl-CoA thioesterase|uniref:hydroxyphenylacetyl-CoA thioesterase PaaI n=1 Tax=Nitratireductor sp. CH_MIT9313-5 TaxID=3107764 RepID=UPI003008B9C1
MTDVQLSAQEVAERSCGSMWARDEASRWLGLKLEEVAPGQATVSLKVEKHHTNGHGICHGGFIFTLADSAFALACNSYNQTVVAQQNSITFIAPARLDDLLVAEAREVCRSGRSGIYDVAVKNQKGELIAAFRGNSRQIKGQHFTQE